MVLIALLASTLAACGFHLRRSVALPPALQHLVVEVDSGGALQRELVLALKADGVDVASQPGPGIGHLRVSVAQFSTRALTVNGYAKVSEYTVTYHVEFGAEDDAGKVILPLKSIDMSREFTYDQSQALGTATRQEQIQKSLVDDMVQAILRQLQAAQPHT
jgi:LPS-assembly lipoprotein